ncbi:MAG: RND transporter, partial [Gammaproteobacteria bacterium]|nr:RND transporter [Gammaproteobacteria bacterium]
MTHQNYDTGSVNPIVLFSINHPKLITWLMMIFTVVIISLAALPNFFPKELPYLHSIKVDTDPENMLADDEHARVYNQAMKKEFSLSDIVVVGVTNEHNAQGVFNTKTLANIDKLTKFALSLTWLDADQPGKTAGVIGIDLLSPSTVDNI